MKKREMIILGKYFAKLCAKKKLFLKNWTDVWYLNQDNQPNLKRNLSKSKLFPIKMTKMKNK